MKTKTPLDYEQEKSLRDAAFVLRNKLESCRFFSVGVTGFLVGLILLLSAMLYFCRSAHAGGADSYIKVAAGPTKQTLSGVWADTANGYQAITDSSPMMSFGFGVSKPRYNFEYGIIYLGKHELDALWGNPDDFANSRSYKTTVGIQSGEVNGLYITLSPKLQFSHGDLHLNLGGIYYKATWRGDFKIPGSDYDQNLSAGPRMQTKSLTWFVGVGGTWGDSKAIRYGIDLNFYPVAVDGAKYKSTWSGGGGYKAVTALEFSVRVPI